MSQDEVDTLMNKKSGLLGKGAIKARLRAHQTFSRAAVHCIWVLEART